MMSNLIGNLNGGNLNGFLQNKKMKGTTTIPLKSDYDDTELRELIAETLVDANNYTDQAIDNFEEQDPTMLSITNQEINEIFSRWE